MNEAADLTQAIAQTGLIPCLLYAISKFDRVVEGLRDHWKEEEKLLTQIVEGLAVPRPADRIPTAPHAVEKWRQ